MGATPVDGLLPAGRWGTGKVIGKNKREGGKRIRTVREDLSPFFCFVLVFWGVGRGSSVEEVPSLRG